MKMRLLIAAALAALLAAQANAQTAGAPPIAFVKSLSTGDEIYLINPNGTELTRIYKAPAKVTVNFLDVRPGGGEIAFTENHRRLKVLSFDDYGRPGMGEPRTIRDLPTTCSLFAPDYHPTNGSVVYIEGCGAANFAAWTVQRGAVARDPSSLFGAYALGKVRWSRDGTRIHYAAERAGGSSSLYLYSRDATGAAAEELGPISSYRTFDVTQTGNRVFWGWDTFKMLDLAQHATTGSAVDLCFRGRDAHFGPGDTDVAYITTAPVRGSYIMVGKSSCEGRDAALTGNGKWGAWLDWRTP